MKKTISNTILVKQNNTNLVTAAFRELGEATNAEISQLTGLSVSTCKNIIRELLESGEIREGNMASSNGGRPSRIFIYNANSSLALCICIVSNNQYNLLDYALVNLQGNIIKKEVTIHDSITVDLLYNIIDKQIQENNSIKAIGIGIPGMTYNGVIKYCDVNAFDGLNLKSLLKERYNLQVLVKNEMHLKAFGYYDSHPEIQDGILAVLNVPEGYTYGAGFVANDQVLTGSTNFSGEINYMPFTSSREDLIKQCQNDETFIPLITKVIITIITIINPTYMILAGYRFTEENSEAIIHNITNSLPLEFLPKFIFNKDISNEYLKGIIAITLRAIINNSP